MTHNEHRAFYTAYAKLTNATRLKTRATALTRLYESLGLLEWEQS